MQFLLCLFFPFSVSSIHQPCWSVLQEVEYLHFD
jgi:hypothetical protein